MRVIHHRPPPNRSLTPKGLCQLHNHLCYHSTFINWCWSIALEVVFLRFCINPQEHAKFPLLVILLVLLSILNLPLLSSKLIYPLADIARNWRNKIILGTTKGMAYLHKCGKPLHLPLSPSLYPASLLLCPPLLMFDTHECVIAHKL